ncbi:hypothetical protein Q4485_00465 [Granulosicoccaceae sp. 1_MG-2023]|nr:hypothetical protein [Granulosicoccaceae sp. 1_MG-2023]
MSIVQRFFSLGGLGAVLLTAGCGGGGSTSYSGDTSDYDVTGFYDNCINSPAVQEALGVYSGEISSYGPGCTWNAEATVTVTNVCQLEIYMDLVLTDWPEYDDEYCYEGPFYGGGRMDLDDVAMDEITRPYYVRVYDQTGTWTLNDGNRYPFLSSFNAVFRGDDTLTLDEYKDTPTNVLYKVQ